jgi:hypothetical protein
MLDYLEVKRFYADKLRDDADGIGRVESAFFHTIKMAYLRGVVDGERGNRSGVGESPAGEAVAWLTDRGAMYFDKEDARRDCDGFIQPLYK